MRVEKPVRWRVEVGYREPGETWSQTWWVATPSTGWEHRGREFSTWRAAYEYAYAAASVVS